MGELCRRMPFSEKKIKWSIYNQQKSSTCTKVSDRWTDTQKHNPEAKCPATSWKFGALLRTFNIWYKPLSCFFSVKAHKQFRKLDICFCFVFVLIVV